MTDTIQKIADDLKALAIHTADHGISGWNGHDKINVIASRLRALSARASAGEGGELARIGELIRTQDNRITDSPIFIVQQKRRIYGIEDGYCENFVWIDGESSYTDEEKTARDAERAEDDQEPAKYRQCGYIDIWEFVTACFTEQGCKDYLARNGHNLKEPRIYADGSYRNEEWRTVRKFLMGLTAAPQPAQAGASGGGDDLAMMVRRLVRAIRRGVAGPVLCDAAMALVERAGHASQPLRDTPASPATGEECEFFPIPAGLHPHTVNLVARFAAALADKLAKAERKYDYSDGWASPDWMDECRAKLMEHVAKGDPRDVAAYCAFLWHHGERTTDIHKFSTPFNSFDVVGEINDAPQHADQVRALADMLDPEKQAATLRRAADSLPTTPPAHGDGEGDGELLDAADDLMRWCVKNVKVWNLPEYDRLHKACERKRNYLTTRPTPEAQEARDAQLPPGHRWLDPEIDMLTSEEAARLPR